MQINSYLLIDFFSNASYSLINKRWQIMSIDIYEGAANYDPCEDCGEQDCTCAEGDVVVNKILCKFYWDCGRNGYLEGVFVATQEEIDAIFGKKVYFGEALGKHSEISGIIKNNDITILSTDQDFIQKAEKYKLVPLGYNPLDYMDEEEEEA